MLPKFPNCEIQKLNIGSKHTAVASCIKFTTIGIERVNESKTKIEIASFDFNIQGKIETVHDFKCLIRTITNSVQELHRLYWRQLTILSSEKADAEAMATIYSAIFQVVLLYGAEFWAMKNGMVTCLKSFHKSMRERHYGPTNRIE